MSNIQEALNSRRMLDERPLLSFLRMAALSPPFGELQRISSFGGLVSWGQNHLMQIRLGLERYGNSVPALGLWRDFLDGKCGNPCSGVEILALLGQAGLASYNVQTGGSYGTFGLSAASRTVHLGTHLVADLLTGPTCLSRKLDLGSRVKKEVGGISRRETTTSDRYSWEFTGTVWASPLLVVPPYLNENPKMVGALKNIFEEFSKFVFFDLHDALQVSAGNDGVGFSRDLRIITLRDGETLTNSQTISSGKHYDFPPGFPISENSYGENLSTTVSVVRHVRKLEVGRSTTFYCPTTEVDLIQLSCNPRALRRMTLVEGRRREPISLAELASRRSRSIENLTLGAVRRVATCVERYTELLAREDVRRGVVSKDREIRYQQLLEGIVSTWSLQTLYQGLSAINAISRLANGDSVSTRFWPIQLESVPVLARGRR